MFETEIIGFCSCKGTRFGMLSLQHLFLPINCMAAHHVKNWKLSSKKDKRL